MKRFVLALVMLLGAGWARAGEDDASAEIHGAEYQEGRGIVMGAETIAAIGLEVVDVADANLTSSARVMGQIYRVAGEGSQNAGERAGYAYASAMVTPDVAVGWAPGAGILATVGGGTVTGGVVMVDRSMLAAGGQHVDLLLEIPDPGGTLVIGAFVEARLEEKTGPLVTVVPRAAVLETAQGYFVFVRNGEAYLRSAVTLGVRGDEVVEIVDGLYAGDAVAATAVETLYLIELRATKGGGHCH